jgi:hypothetical protein
MEREEMSPMLLQRLSDHGVEDAHACRWRCVRARVWGGWVIGECFHHEVTRQAATSVVLAYFRWGDTEVVLGQCQFCKAVCWDHFREELRVPPVKLRESAASIMGGFHWTRRVGG